MATTYPALRPLERNRMYEELAERLGMFIHESAMAPGDRFPPERELARRLGVSRTSIRQATVVLQALGFVDIRHGEGMYLRRIRGFGESVPKLVERRRRLPEVLEAREALETKLAELAAQRRSEDDLLAMRASLQLMESEIQSGKLGTDGDAAFHHALALAASNTVLVRLMDQMASAIEETRVESLSEPGRPPRSVAAHDVILSAIEARDPGRAVQAMRNHLKEVADVSLLRWQPAEAESGPARS